MFSEQKTVNKIINFIDFYLFLEYNKNMTNKALFLDDERFPPQKSNLDFIIARDVSAAKDIYKSWKINFISFDHDLGENQETGLEFANWLINQDLDNAGFISDDFTFYVHSQNPIGKKNIEDKLNSYLSFRVNDTRKNLKI